MPINAAYCRPYLGRMVIAHSRYGAHTGTLREIRRDGIVLANARAVQVNADQTEGLKIEHADRPEEAKADVAFWPFLFLPFLALAALGPWGWGGYGYGYGYPGYYW